MVLSLNPGKIIHVYVCHGREGRCQHWEPWSASKYHFEICVSLFLVVLTNGDFSERKINQKWLKLHLPLKEIRTPTLLIESLVLDHLVLSHENDFASKSTKNKFSDQISENEMKCNCAFWQHSKKTWHLRLPFERSPSFRHRKILFLKKLRIFCSAIVFSIAMIRNVSEEFGRLLNGRISSQENLLLLDRKTLFLQTVPSGSSKQEKVMTTLGQCWATKRKVECTEQKDLTSNPSGSNAYIFINKQVENAAWKRACGWHYNFLIPDDLNAKLAPEKVWFAFKNVSFKSLEEWL